MKIQLQIHFVFSMYILWLTTFRTIVGCRSPYMQVRMCKVDPSPWLSVWARAVAMAGEPELCSSFRISCVTLYVASPKLNFNIPSCIWYRLPAWYPFHLLPGSLRQWLVYQGPTEIGGNSVDVIDANTIRRLSKNSPLRVPCKNKLLLKFAIYLHVFHPIDVSRSLWWR